jgi:hypothetical protein
LEELRMTRSHIAAGLLVALSMGLFAGCAKSGGDYTGQEMAGEWTGESQAVHTLMGYSHTVRTMTVTDQDGNQFRGVMYYKTTAEAQLREGEKKVYGTINPADGKVTIISGEDDGIFSGTLSDANTLNLTFTEAGPGGIVSNIKLVRVTE